MFLLLLASRRPVAAALAMSALASTAQLGASIARLGAKGRREVMAPRSAEPTGTYQVSFSKMIVNNLGGLGPDTQKAKELRIMHEITYAGKQIQLDTVIEAITPYKGNVKYNAVHGRHLLVNVAAGTSVALKVSCQDHQTGRPIILDRFSLSIMDLDHGRNVDNSFGGFEAVLAGPLLSYSVTDTTQVQISSVPGSNDFFVFNSSELGDMNDNPVEGEPLTQLQQDKAVFLEFASTSKYRLQLSASPARTAGRTFMMGGAWMFSQNAFHRTYVGPCSEQHRLDLSTSQVLSTDLTGRGMRFSNVFPYYSHAVDLVVTADNDYLPWTKETNGLNGACGIINLAAGHETNLTFTFIDSATDSAVRMEKFFFSVLDVDKTKGEGVERVIIDKRAWSNRWLSSESRLRETVDDNFVTYDTIVFGDSSENPTDPMQLSEDQKVQTVTFFRKEPVHQFHIKIAATENTFTGRNILFAGRTNYVCPQLA